MTATTRRRFCAGLGTALAVPALIRAQPTTHVIEIHRFRFNATMHLVRVGERVAWHNRDSAPHTATDASGRWDTGRIDRDQTVALVFDTPGRYAYFCRFHPHMQAELTVLE